MTRRHYRRPPPRIGRRGFLAGLGAVAALPAYGDALLDGAALGVEPNIATDQTADLLAALEKAVAEGRPLYLPAGQYLVDGLLIPGSVTIVGLQGQTYLVASGTGPAARIVGSSDVALEGLCFAGPPSGGPSGEQGLLEIERSAHVNLSRCRFSDTHGHGLVARESAANIDRCAFGGIRGAAIFSRDSIGGLIVTNNRVTGCGNGGILIWGSSPGHRDGSIILGNTIKAIFAEGGGNGQNGNGVNVFNADNVIVADNQIDDCAFTAVRCNTTKNAQIRGNICTRCGEVAIFSEFGFSGSVVEGNIIDGAATGISITNLDSGGRLAVCANNIVRNIIEASPVNPDTKPVGIYVEAETTVTGNTIDGVPGIGILAGYGPYLRNVIVANNVLSGISIGIGVSVVDNPSPGPVRISGNLISEPLDHGIVGMAWDDIVSDDLVRDAAKFPHVRMGDNSVVKV